MAKAAPLKIQTLLSDNGKEFTDQLLGSRANVASDAHELDTLCDTH